MSAVPAWVEVLTACFVVVGGLLALIGAAGLWRFKSFFQRAHAPALATAGGAWAFALATALYFSFSRETAFVHALLIPGFIAITAPITTVFLMRAGLFRARLAGQGDVPPSLSSRGHDGT